MNTTDPNLGVDAEYEFVSARCGAENRDWELQEQALKWHDGIPYDILIIKLSNGAVRHFHFDISKLFGKGPSDLDWLFAD